MSPMPSQSKLKFNVIKKLGVQGLLKRHTKNTTAFKRSRSPNPERKQVGRRIYDSVLGVTCHWCRQKTVEPHVGCCRCPIKFCGQCLLNRNGEIIADEMSKGVHWTCPKCRGGCGPGCSNCCNCGPCRKSQGLEPTGQLAGKARLLGLSSVHDYLIHLKTKEPGDVLALRKENRGWTKSTGGLEGSAQRNNNAESQDIGSEESGIADQKAEGDASGSNGENGWPRAKGCGAVEKKSVKDSTGREEKSGLGAEFKFTVKQEAVDKVDAYATSRDKQNNWTCQNLAHGAKDRALPQFIDLMESDDEEESDSALPEVMDFKGCYGMQSKESRKDAHNDDVPKGVASDLDRHEQGQAGRQSRGLGKDKNGTSRKDAVQMNLLRALSSRKAQRPGGTPVLENRTSVRIAESEKNKRRALFSEKTQNPRHPAVLERTSVIGNKRLQKRRINSQSKGLHDLSFIEEEHDAYTGPYDFEKKLQAMIQTPFSSLRLSILMDAMKRPRRKTRMREIRTRSIEVPSEEGSESYLDRHSEVRDLLAKASGPQEMYRLLRSFFFWISHSCMDGAYKPWSKNDNTDDCYFIPRPHQKVVCIDLSNDEDNEEDDGSVHNTPISSSSVSGGKLSFSSTQVKVEKA